MNIYKNILYCIRMLVSNFIAFLWIYSRFVNKPSGSIGLYDATEIYNRHQLKSHMKEAMVKLGHHLIFFFFYLYNMIVALLS